MKLQHYLGGLEGLGPVSTETRVFVETWETRIFGIHTAMMALSHNCHFPRHRPISRLFGHGRTFERVPNP